MPTEVGWDDAGFDVKVLPHERRSFTEGGAPAKEGEMKARLGRSISSESSSPLKEIRRH